MHFDENNRGHMENVWWVLTHQFCKGTSVEAIACNKKVQLTKGASTRDSSPTQCKALTSQASYKAVFWTSKPKFTFKQGVVAKVRVDPFHQISKPGQHNIKAMGKTKKHAAQKEK